MADYVRVTHQDVKAEKMKRHKAQFEYLKLKQQVNPHFLFNSLNVLDCLICDNKNEDASLLSTNSPAYTGICLKMTRLRL